MLTKLAFLARRRHRAILAAGCMALLGSCGGGGGSAPSGNGGQTPTPSPSASSPPAATTCTLRARQDWALAQLQEWYLFPTLFNSAANPASYATLLDYVDALVAPARAQNRDRYFTYTTSIAEENAYYQQGASGGFGIRLSYQGSQVFVSEAFEGAPALAAGIDRGTEILNINGQSVASLIASLGSGGVIQALGPDTPGTSRTLTVRDPGGGPLRTVTIAKATYSLDPVSNRYGARVLTDGAKKVGYVNLRTFIDTANANLTAAFADFKAQGVTELIIDLRYNGGGLLSVAELLGNLMALGRGGQVFGYVAFRDSKAAENETALFSVLPQSIAPTKIAFIGTGGTASASELIINAMVPYLGSNMALVGGNTYGKPVGQIALDRAACDDRLRAVAFKFDNANRQGEYYNGLATTVPVTCRATDDVTRPLGDPAEGMIRASLDFLAGRSCTAIASVTSGASVSTERVGTPAAQQLLTPEVPASTFEREVPGAF
ncbi:MAG: peptidase S41 [Sphingomonadales bacterium 12-68-11]|nr:MAG: peptidase S41 [Sphingomonadales bacterium 12-68-11]